MRAHRDAACHRTTDTGIHCSARTPSRKDKQLPSFHQRLGVPVAPMLTLADIVMMWTLAHRTALLTVAIKPGLSATNEDNRLRLGLLSCRR